MSDINKNLDRFINATKFKQTEATPKIKVTNPFSGQSIDLTEDENKLYLSIKMAELTENYTFMQKQIDKFSRLNPKAYRVLVD